MAASALSPRYFSECPERGALLSLFRDTDTLIPRTGNGEIAWTYERKVQGFSSSEEQIAWTQTAKRPNWRFIVEERIDDLSSLPENWDSYGGMKTDQGICAVVMDLLSLIMEENTPAPVAIPLSNGGIQLEWHTRGIDLTIRVDSPDHFTVSFEDLRTGKLFEDDLSYDLSALKDPIRSLTARK